MQPSPKKSPGPNIATTASLYVHYRFCRLTLGVNGLVSVVFHHFSRHAGSIEKLLGIKRAERWKGLGILAGFALHFGCHRYFTQKAPARPNKVTRDRCVGVIGDFAIWPGAR